MYVLPLLDTLGNAPVWSLAINPSANLTVMNTKFVFAFTGSCCGIVIASTIASVLSSAKIYVVVRGLPLFVVDAVDCVPLGNWRMCPASVTSSMAMNLLIALAVKPGHPWR